MRRKHLLALLLLLTAVTLGIWLEPTRVVWGWLRGEAFYQGRPTSYWKTELQRWQWSEAISHWGPVGSMSWHKSPTWLESKFPFLVKQPLEPPLLNPDASALPVLLELSAGYDDLFVCLSIEQLIVCLGLENIRKVKEMD
ncbi:MAG: hypothetical protein HY040_16115 [Planctomycetes bacterium]|nr:hypothetical protein [Planctomycetota bacterium]